MVKIRTIDELEALYYSPAGAEFIRKADAPLLTTTTGVYNAIYGALVWAQLNQEANVFGCLPKYVWSRSGWRIITARAATSGGGVAEAGTLPDSIRPTFEEVSTKPKSMVHVFEVSEIQQFMAAESEDDAFGSMEQMRVIMGIHHKEMANVALLSDVEAAAAGAGADYTGRNEFETLDRVISSDSEEDAFGGSYNNWYDIYGLDRDTATTYDSIVLHNSGVDRDLTDDLIRDLIYRVREKGGNPSVFVTGHDAYDALQGVYTNYVRYSPLGETEVSLSVNGIQSPTGYPVGIKIPSVYGIPLILSKDVPKDTISRVFLLDISDPEGFGIARLGLMVAKPTQYFEAGMLTGNPFAIGKLSNKGMYRTAGEIICRHFPSQGKLRDLK